jgi:hypothetical protein
MILALTCWLLGQNEPKPEALQAVVVAVEGDVEFRKPDKSKKWSKLAKDSRLDTGDQIQTGLKSKCLLRVGEAIRVLVRSSSFATLTRTYVEKNKIEGEVRLDVGSLFIETQEPRPENVDFKVSTPVGTASIRGSGMLVAAGEMGTEVTHLHGAVSAWAAHRPEAELGEHARFRLFVLLHSGDLAALTGMFPFVGRPDAFPNLQLLTSGLAQDHTFRQAQDFTQSSQDIGGDAHCRLRAFGDNSILFCSPLIRWAFHFDVPTNDFDGLPLTRLVDIGGNNNNVIGLIRNQPVFILQKQFPQIGPAFWRFTSASGRQFIWNPIQKVWIPN